MGEKFLVLVYGSLKKGYRLSRYMERSRFIGPARTAPNYRLVDLGPYPAIVHAPPGAGREVDGELYEVDEESLRLLDRVEGVPDLYDRQPIDVQGVAGTVFGYVYQRPVAPPRGEQ